jgi:NitT/TauT family transport system substrate-binding protein
MNTTSARDIAKAEKPLFPNIDEDVLADCIAAYQNMGCWPPEMHITDKGFEAMLDIFAHDGKITRRHAYDDICLRLG